MRIITTIGALVLGLSLLYFYIYKPTSLQVLDSPSETSYEKAINSTNSAFHCILTNDNLGIKIDVYIDKNKSKLITTNSISSEVSYSLNDSNHTYAWIDGLNFGSKFAEPVTYDENITIPEDIIKANIYGLASNGYATTCKKSFINDSFFIPPKNIEFTELK